MKTLHYNTLYGELTLAMQKLEDAAQAAAKAKADHKGQLGTYEAWKKAQKRAAMLAARLAGALLNDEQEG